MTPLFIKEYNQVLDEVAADRKIWVVILQAKARPLCRRRFELLKALDTAPKARATIRKLVCYWQNVSHAKPIMLLCKAAAGGNQLSFVL